MRKVATPRKRTPALPSRARFLFLMPCTATLLRVAALAAPAALLSGCIDWDAWANATRASDSRSNTPMSPMPGHSLPRPSAPKFGPPELDAAGQKRLDEVEAFLLAQYLAARWQIMATTQTNSGDIYDWIDVNSVEGAEKAPPPPPTPEEMKLPDGAELQLMELEMDPELERPAGTVPVRRPDFAAYVFGESEASSLEDFLTDDVASGDAAGGNDRLYAGTIVGAPNRGANASINAFGGRIEKHTMSVLEMIVGCRKNGEMRQAIGIAASRDYATQGFHNFGDSTLRLQVEFFTEGYKVVGARKGGWSGTKRRGLRQLRRSQ